MKNIVLLGAPRSGKSTFAKMIAKEYQNFNIIQEDIVNSAYITAYMDSENQIIEDERIVIDMNLASDISKMLFIASVQCEPKLNYILETIDFDMKDINKLKEFSHDLIFIVFGYPNLTIEKGLENILKYDTEYDWTYGHSKDSIRNLLNVYIKCSKNYEEQCKVNNIKFVDTSTNREQVLNDLLKWVKEEFKK